MDNSPKRERTFSWDDPLQSAKKAAHLAGSDFLQAITEGAIPTPPIMHALDIKIGTLAKGQVTFTFLPQEFHYNPIGTVHGGVITTILDSAMGCSLHTLLPAGTVYTTLEIKVNFIKAITIKSGELTATGKVLHNGSRTALTDAQLTGADGTVYAHATSTCLVMKL